MEVYTPSQLFWQRVHVVGNMACRLPSTLGMDYNFCAAYYDVLAYKSIWP